MSRYSRCPINKGEDCVYSNCMWWCDFASDCSVHFLLVLIAKKIMNGNIFPAKEGD